MYGLYKQATEGNCPATSTVSFWDLRGQSKRRAWLELADTPKTQAMRLYLATLLEVRDKLLRGCLQSLTTADRFSTARRRRPR
jgi:acyl-CoA-binding protein